MRDETTPEQAPSADAPRRRRRRARRKDRRGVALIMVVGAITVLTVFLTELQEQTSSELSAALADRDALRAEYYARSAINLSRLLISSEPSVRAKLLMSPIGLLAKGKLPQIPVWEFSDMVLGPFNDQTSAAAFGGSTGIDLSTGKNLGLTGGGRFELKIVDEDSKINMNLAAKGDAISQLRLSTQLVSLLGPQQFNTLFEGRDADDQFSDRAAICGALVDWADDDENLNSCDVGAQAGASGVEDNFYQMIGLPYVRKNAAYDSLEELRMVRGISDDFWSTFVDPDPSDPRKRVVTVWSQGAVNVNNANAQTLLALVCSGAVEGTELCIDPVQMQSFLIGVTMAKGFTMGAPLFNSPKDFTATMKGKGMIGPMLASLGVTPVAFKGENDFRKTISTESKMFSIYAEGVVPGNKRETRLRIHTVVDFRAAQPPGESLSILLQGGGGPGGANGQNPASGAADAGPEAIIQAMQANPAGAVVYWHVE